MGDGGRTSPAVASMGDIDLLLLAHPGVTSMGDRELVPLSYPGVVSIGLAIDCPPLSNPGVTLVPLASAARSCSVGGRITWDGLGVDVARGAFLSPGVTRGVGIVWCAWLGAEYDPVIDDLESSESYCFVALCLVAPRLGGGTVGTLNVGSCS